jgi:hypothetical protein
MRDREGGKGLSAIYLAGHHQGRPSLSLGLQEAGQLEFFLITQDQIRLPQGGEGLGGGLGVAAGGDDEGIRVATDGLAEGLTGLSIGRRSDSTGIDDIEVSPLWPGNDLVSLILQDRCQGLRIGLIGLAA